MDACAIKGENHPYNKNAIDFTNIAETIFSTRIPEEQYNELLNLLRVIFLNRTIEEIESALVSYAQRLRDEFHKHNAIA